MALVSVAQYGFICSMLGVYMLSIGKGLGMLFYDVHVGLPAWTLAGSAFVFIFHANGQALGSWKGLICLNCCTILGTILIPITYMAIQGSAATRPAGSSVVAFVEDISVADLATSLSTFAFAFSGQFILVEVMSEMRDPEEFPKACFQLAAPFQGASFLLVGLAGYYYMGSSVVGMIADNIPFGAWFRVASALLATHMLVTYLIKGVVITKAIYRRFVKDDKEDELEPDRAWCALVAAVLALSWLISQLVPFFNDLVDVLGTSLVPLCCWLMPIVLLYWQWSQGSGGKRPRISIAEAVVLGLEVVFAVVQSVVGTYTCVNTIIHHWRTYGAPFAPHCENMWAICACSLHHAGMEECLKPMLSG